MDNIARGSRRARHVAANAAAAASEADAEGTERRRSRRQQQESAAATITTPEAAAQHVRPGSARTPALRYSAQVAPPVRRRHHPHQQQQRQNQNEDQEQMTPDDSHELSGQQNISPAGVAGGVGPHPFRLHTTRQYYTGTRLSVPYDSDESASEPDVSILAMPRSRHTRMDHQMPTMRHDDGDEEAASSQGQHDVEVEDPSIEDASAEEDQDEDDEDGEDDDNEEEHEDMVNLIDPADMGLKEISNLGRFTVSSHKPGNGVEELRSDDLKLYWQSDGPQPHKLTVYFVKRVGIRDIRFFVDYHEDESYTPTKMVFKSGTSENNLIEFATMTMDSPSGWQQVPLGGTGGAPDGNTLVSYVLQMQVLENHQNGKDTHLRGIKIYAFDSDAAQAGATGAAADDMADSSLSKDSGAGAWNAGDLLGDIARSLAAARLEGGETGFAMPDFMREPEIR